MTGRALGGMGSCCCCCERPQAGASSHPRKQAARGGVAVGALSLPPSNLDEAARLGAVRALVHRSPLVFVSSRTEISSSREPPGRAQRPRLARSRVTIVPARRATELAGARTTTTPSRPPAPFATVSSQPSPLSPRRHAGHPALPVLCDARGAIRLQGCEGGSAAERSQPAGSPTPPSLPLPLCSSADSLDCFDLLAAGPRVGRQGRRRALLGPHRHRQPGRDHLCMVAGVTGRARGASLFGCPPPFPARPLPFSLVDDRA